MTVPGDNRICTKNGLGIHHCGETETCGNPFDYDIPLENEDNANNALISYGIPNFNNLGNSMLLIMSLVSTDGWSQFMYNFIDVDHPAIGIIYSLIMIVIGNFFLMNLILAVIMDTYVIYQERDIKKKMKHVKTNTIEINEEELNIAVIAPMEEQQELEWVDEVTKPLLEELPEDEDEAATKRSNESQEASEVLEDESVNEEDLSGEEGAELAD